MLPCRAINKSAHEKIAAMHFENQRRVGSERSRVIFNRVLFVVPTSRSFAPLASRISGMRKPPPIWISSPREITTSFFSR